MARKPADALFHSGQSERLMVDAPLIHGFVETFLQDSYDSPHPIPAFHDQLWELECSPDPWVAAAAPRGHAKSTSGNHAYGLANLIFGRDDFAVILSSTERLAVGHLKSIKDPLWNNKELIQAAEIEVVRDVETELVVRCHGREFCVMAFGAEANLRGALWRNRRPSLIIGDDLENDELVMNPDRREKFWNWIMNAVLPMGSDHARFRFLGTILHMASALERFLGDPSWRSRRFRAHDSFDDFSSILWPEKFPEERLRRIRQLYIDGGNSSGYSQEYLSHPVAEEDAFFRKTDFLSMTDKMRRKAKLFYVGGDFAVEQKQKSDYTAFPVAGIDDEGRLSVVDVVKGRWDSKTIIEKMFEIERRYHGVEMWFLEEGVIRKVLGPFLYAEMVRQGIYMNITLYNPVKDKPSRCASFQARMRAGGVFWDTTAEWYPGVQASMLTFPRGIHDDVEDGLGLLGRGLAELRLAPSDDEAAEAEWEEERRRSEPTDDGRSTTTGY